MAANMLLRKGVLPVALGSATVPQRASPCAQRGAIIVRAEAEKKESDGESKSEEKSKAVQKVDRKKDTLFFASDQSLAYLTGDLPADYGFDPLGLSDPDGVGGFISPEWLTYSEVIHCRFAMLGAAGIITPEILSNVGVIPQTADEVLWFKSGLVPPLGTYEKGYWLDPWSLFFIEVILVQFAELKRWQDFRHPGSQGEQYFLGLEKVLGGSGTPAYPGGQFFNLFNLGKSDADLKTLKTKEIKNGRLAMVAVFGYGAQAILTGVGPFQNLKDHLADPANNNILTNFSFGG